jgi:guanylate kinase
LVVVSGPSGVGKGTMLKRIFAKYPDRLVFSISTTTRAPRPNEIHGREYFFTTKESFIVGKEQGNFLEWAEYAGNFYGTPRQPVLDNIAAGKVVILEIELLGARQVAESFPSARRIFISPPSLAELEQRLRSRSTDDGAQVAKRLAHAELELAAASEFDQIIVNDDLDQATMLLEQAIFA